jgi:hypothetical protein
MKKLSVIFLVSILALTMIMPAGLASAEATVEVSGEYTVTATRAECINEYSCGSGVVTVCFSFESTYEGDLIGTAQECLYCGFSPCSYTISRVGIKTFTGTVLGKEGTFTAYVRHQFLGNGDFQVEQTIISGTDELAGIQGTLVFMVTETDTGVWEGTYSGSVAFAQ